MARHRCQLMHPRMLAGLAVLVAMLFGTPTLAQDASDLRGVQRAPYLNVSSLADNVNNSR